MASSLIFNQLVVNTEHRAKGIQRNRVRDRKVREGARNGGYEKGRGVRVREREARDGMEVILTSARVSKAGGPVGSGSVIGYRVRFYILSPLTGFTVRFGLRQRVQFCRLAGLTG